MAEEARLVGSSYGAENAEMVRQPVLSPDFDFLYKVEASGPFNASHCFQCRKCTNGCPVSFAMDIFPDRIIRLAILGQTAEVLNSRTIWICASCETCSTRCPNGVRIAELMDYFKELAVEAGIRPALPAVAVFYRTFLDNLKLTGRVFEAGLLPTYWVRSRQVVSMFKSGEMRKNVEQAVKLFMKKRLSALPGAVRGRGEIRSILRSSRPHGRSQ
ncbi:MAG: 4Fe-4S dicluster domain-containing protein [Deltaproteobacteria bacterium]|jgi:heterodisulfide reductase subunit C|nr:4Fe-4S dicluster domain-containing protein [Deltaproteobacteria bacterium]